MDAVDSLDVPLGHKEAFSCKNHPLDRSSISVHTGLNGSTTSSLLPSSSGESIPNNHFPFRVVKFPRRSSPQNLPLGLKVIARSSVCTSPGHFVSSVSHDQHC